METSDDATSIVGDHDRDTQNIPGPARQSEVTPSYSEGRPKRKRKPSQNLDGYHVYDSKKESFADFIKGIESLERSSIAVSPTLFSRRGRSKSPATPRLAFGRLVGNTPSSHRTPSLRTPTVNSTAEDHNQTSHQSLTLFEQRRLHGGFTAAASAVSTRPKPYLPSQSQLVPSSVWWRWNSRRGRELDRLIGKAISKEDETDKRNGNPRRRKIDMEYFTAVLWCFLGFVYIKRRLKTRAIALVKSLFENLLVLYPDLFLDPLLKESRKLMRREVFQAWKFQRTIDLSATGGLNYEAINSIRRGVEELPLRSQGCIPHGSTISRAAKLLEDHAANEFGLRIEETVTRHGPSLSFNFDNYLRLVLKGYGLDQIAESGSTQRPVLIAHTLDGAQLTMHLGHVTAGIKIVDPRAQHPTTGMPLITQGLYQSRDLCFPCLITFGKDCKQLYEDCFSDFHQRFNNGLVIPANVGEPELSNFQVVSNQDMSSFWKTTGLGGGSHNKRRFCFVCMCDNQRIGVHQTHNERCEICQRLGIDRCYCHPVNDSDFIEERRVLLSTYVQLALDEGYQKLDAITKESTSLTDETQANRFDNPNHIDFEPQNNDEELSCFLRLLAKELKLRLRGDRSLLNTVLKGNLETRRLKLKELIRDEKDIKLARCTVDRHDQVNAVTQHLAIEAAIPCILHMEMRVNEKLFHSLLSQGWSRYDDGESKKRQLFIQRVSDCMRTVVLGDEDSGRESQWTFPLSRDGKTLESRSMTNVHSRKCIKGLKILSSVVFHQDLDQNEGTPQQTREENRRYENQWRHLLDLYNPIMKNIRKHEDFAASEVDELHLLTSRFMDAYVDLLGSKHVTNYVHMIGAGHLFYYLTRYGNLYKFSQQGWEAMNQKLKHFYFNNTNHGGCLGNSTGEMIAGDHVRPLMRMCLRFTMWALGHGDEFFLALKNKNDDDGDVVVANDDEPVLFGEL